MNLINYITYTCPFLLQSAVPIIVQGPPKEYQSDNPPAAVDPTTIAVQRIQSQESLEFHGWVVVNVASPDQVREVAYYVVLGNRSITGCSSNSYVGMAMEKMATRI